VESENFSNDVVLFENVNSDVKNEIARDRSRLGEIDHWGLVGE
jgi:hypothetical protein